MELRLKSLLTLSRAFFMLGCAQKKTGKEVAVTAADILGNPEYLAFSSFQIGFQTGSFAPGTQTINQVAFNAKSDYTITTEWTSYSIPLAKLDQGAD